MAVSIISGSHLTSTNKRHLTEMVKQGLAEAYSKRIDYKMSLIEGTTDSYDVTVSMAEVGSNGRRFVRSTMAKVRITGV